MVEGRIPTRNRWREILTELKLYGCCSCGLETEDFEEECPVCGGPLEEVEQVDRTGELLYNAGLQHAAGYRW